MTVKSFTLRAAKSCPVFVNGLGACRVGFTVGFLWSRGFFEVELDGVEDAVDELGGFEGGEAAGYLKGFVYDDCVRCVLVEEFINGQAENVAVDHGHPFDPPVLGACADLVVDGGEVAESPMDQVVGEAT